LRREENIVEWWCLVEIMFVIMTVNRGAFMSRNYLLKKTNRMYQYGAYGAYRSVRGIPLVRGIPVSTERLFIKKNKSWRSV